MKKITYLKPLSFLIALLCVVSFGFGQIVAWEMLGITGDEATVNATTLDGNLNMSTLSRGSGLNPSAFGDSFSSSSFTTSGLQTDAITNDDYLQFQVSPSIGYQFSLSTLDATFRRSNTGPNSFIWKYSTDGVNFIDIGFVISYTTNAGNGTVQAQINLTTIPALQNVVSGTTITFRLYGWGAGGGTGTFAIGRLGGNDLSIGGTVIVLPACAGTTTTWDGTSWNNGAPDSTTPFLPAVINGTYTTNPTDGSFSACSLIVNGTLNINDGYFVEIENDVTVDGGTISVTTKGAFVQNGLSTAAGAFSIINSGNAYVNKTTKPYNDAGLHYVYWGSPVTNANITTVFPNPDDNRRYSFNASVFLDEHTVGTTNGVPDDIDDDGNDWVTESGSMTPGHGYSVTATAPPPVPSPFPYSDIAQFSGEFNTGNIDVTIYRNDTELTDSNWNFLGNPYPSSISTDDFFTLNGYDAILNTTGAIENILYLWTHNSLADNANPGNEGYNFSQDDYAYINLSGGIAAISGGDIPNKYVPSGQGFFIEMSDDVVPTGGSSPIFSDIVTFNNNMRRADGTSNSQFFKNSNPKGKQNNINEDKLWVNLTSDNGVFNQILVAYANGASNNDDGLSYDAKRIISGNASILYSTIDECDKKFAIQGKATNSLNEDEVIKLGFKTSIDVATLYKLSIAQLQGEFLTINPVYLKDNLLNKLHDLKTGDYNFTSEVGEFNDRFEIVFNANALSVDDVTTNSNTLKIVELEDDHVQFTTSNNLNIKTVSIFDLLGRQLYNFKGQNSSETYTLSNLSSTIYIAKVELSNGAIITKKAFKK